ncbi:hypothetical protein V8G54_028324, partial [Vigna mungo]
NNKTKVPSLHYAIAAVIVAVSLTTPLLVQSLRGRRERERKKNYGFGWKFVAERYFVLEILFSNISQIMKSLLWTTCSEKCIFKLFISMLKVTHNRNKLFIVLGLRVKRGKVFYRDDFDY